jgi:hypothetical protein
VSTSCKIFLLFSNDYLILSQIEIVVLRGVTDICLKMLVRFMKTAETAVFKVVLIKAWLRPDYKK